MFIILDQFEADLIFNCSENSDDYFEIDIKEISQMKQNVDYLTDEFDDEFEE